MSECCSRLHKLFNAKDRIRYPFGENQIPLDGIYILFEKGEYAHGGDRIVRVGTHSGIKQLPSRLRQHFICKKKDRSIFRKNIGRAILNKRKDSFLRQWEHDLTFKKARAELSSEIDFDYQQEVEREVSEYIQKNLSFIVFEIEDKNKRLDLESKIISTISLCKECKASADWLGNFSTKLKIQESGLWQVNELYKNPFTNKDIAGLELFFIGRLNRRD